MHNRRAPLLTAALLLPIAMSACAEKSKLASIADSEGPNPTIPAPAKRLIPTVQIAPAVGWAAGAHPVAAQGLQVEAFAQGLDHPRALYVLPNGDVLVAETNGPPRPEDNDGIKAKVQGLVMKRAGAGVPSANRISLLRDADGDGKAEVHTVFLEDLYSPFGMALVGDTLYVANADALVKFPYQTGATAISAAPVKVADLPGGPINHHWTKALVASADGSRLYVGVGSNSNIVENGFAAEKDRADVLEIDAATGATRVYASGLRNPTALAWRPGTDMLYAVVNERDELGSDLVPDYLTSVKPGAFYGWPYSYFGQHVDTRVKPQDAAMVAKAIPPDYALGTHVAPLGLAFNAGAGWPAPFADGAFVGLHGSWNRQPMSGYKVDYVPFAGDKPSGAMQDVLTGFLDAKGNAQGRPVNVVLDGRNALLVADDVGNTVWRVVPTNGIRAPAAPVAIAPAP